MNTEQTIAAAGILFDLRHTGTTMDDLPESSRPEDLESAYRTQSELVARLESRHNGSTIGFKIACTNKHAQQLLNTDGPVFGRLSSCFTHSSPARIRGTDYSLLGIEPEFAFEIDRDVPTSEVPYSADSIVDYVGGVMPAIELVGHRLSDWSRFDAPTLVADNALHQAWIPGPRASNWRQLDFAAHAVELLVNDAVTLNGSGANVLGNPLNALAWLANELPDRGQRLKAGDLITTGTCTDVYIASVGDEVRADFGALGSVELKLV